MAQQDQSTTTAQSEPVAPVAQTTAEGKLDFSPQVREHASEFNWPLDSKQELDENDKPMWEVETDPETGEAILDPEFHSPKLKLDSSGNPIPKMTPQPPQGSQVLVKLRWRTPTRGMRQKATNEGMMAYYRRHKRQGVDVSVVERVLLNDCLIETNIKGVPGPGWDSLTDSSLGDHILRATGIMEHLSGTKAIEEGKGRSPVLASR